MNGAGRALLLGLLLLATPLGHSAAPLDQSWRHQGYAAEYSGLSLFPATDPLDPLGWSTYRVTVTHVSPDRIELHVVAARAGTPDTLDARISYDAQTRTGTSGGSYFWIGEPEIAQGRALLGERTALLTTQTDQYYQYNAGGSNYYYSTQTGLLLRAESVTDLGAVLRTE